MVYSHPFNYYYSKLMEGLCPFCNEPLEFIFGNNDTIYCSAYNGYLSLYDDATVAGSDGPCRECLSTDPLEKGFNSASVNNQYRQLTTGIGFICEHCNHGVNFDDLTAFQRCLERHDSTECVHCKWHNSKSPKNPMSIPLI